MTEEQVQRLEQFRRTRHEGAECGYSLPQLTRAMAAPFGYKTLQKALLGRPVWDLHHTYIVSWLDRFVPAGLPVVDFSRTDVSDHELDSQMFRDGLYSGRREKPQESEGVPGKGSPERNDAEETGGATGTVRGSR